MKIKKFEHIFRAYDIRGIFGKDLTPEIAEQIGKAFGTFIGEGELVVGMDARLSGPELKEAIVSGLISTGCNVIDIGIIPTPVLYSHIARNKKDGGVMITGSHTPPEFNGFKFIGKNGITLNIDTGVGEIRKIFLSGNFRQADRNGKVSYDDTALDCYKKFMLEKAKRTKKLKIILDTSNGPTSLVVPDLLRRLGHEVIVINERLDGKFPGHKPEPRPEHLTELAKIVKNEKADIGIAFDGDGDRAAFLDENGKMLAGEIPIILFSKEILEKEKGASIVYDIRCSDVVPEKIKEFGGNPIVSRCGYSYIMGKMKEVNGPYAGESSSHHFFRENYSFDDGIFASLKVVEILSRSNSSLSQIADLISLYPKMHDVNFPCSDETKFKIIEKIKKRFKEMDCRIVDIDGVKAIFDDGWVLVRASNTEPLIRIGVEAKEERRLQKLFELGKELLTKEMKLAE